MKVAVVGGGRMGEAVVANLVRTGVVLRADLMVAETREERRFELFERYGVSVTGDAGEAVSFGDVTVLSVKPQVLDDVLASLFDHFHRGELVISIAAGKTIAGIEAMLPEGVALVRVMPNLAAQVSEGISAFCCGSMVSPEQREVAGRLLGCFGDVVEMPESQFDAVTALSGSGPAFFAYVAEQMIQGAVALGISKQDAFALTVQTMLGTGKLLKSEQKTPLELIAAVSSKGGTTEAGMGILNGSDLAAVVAETLRVAAERSGELRM